MPIVKPISGHTRLGGAQRYLERDGRALARDFLNLDAPEGAMGPDGLPTYGDYDWASAMDATRAAFGNDSPHGGRRARTYKHYVISPDPRDRVSLAGLRRVTMSWVEENFGDYEVAVVYHDDNGRRIPHAHVVVNNTNLATGRRLQDPEPRALKRSMQRIAAENGLSTFADEPRDPATGRHPDSMPYARRNAHIVERDLVARGEYSWVGDIRARVGVAMCVARTPEDFRAALAEMGVTVRDSSTRRGDWVYALADAPTRQVGGGRLGASYTRREVTRWLRSPARAALAPLSERNVREAAASAIEVRDLGELTRLSEAVGTLSRGRWRSLAAMDSAVARLRATPGREAAADRLERTRDFCAAHAILPEREAPARRPRRAQEGGGGWGAREARPHDDAQVTARQQEATRKERSR